MGENNKFTRLTLEQNGLKVTWEVPNENVYGEDMMNAIRTIMGGLTWSEDQIYDAMANYLCDHAYDKYNIIEKK